MNSADPAAARASRLRSNADFLKLWTGSTISEFGSLVTAVALPFAAILTLGASPIQMALLRACDIVPALIVALVAGVWVDRLRRRPILIASDLGRAILLATIPAAAVAGVLGLGQLYAVTFFAAILSHFFDVAYRSYLPSIVAREDLIDANSKLSATASIAEVGAFSLAGWLVQVLTAPFAILIDAASFLFSALFVWRIRSAESRDGGETAAPRDIRREAVEGASFVLRDPILRPLAVAVSVGTLGNGLFGTQYSLYALQSLGFKPAVLGVIYAVGGASSLLGALLVHRISKRIGVGVAMILGLTLWGIGELCLPLARSANLVGAALLIAQQLSDGAAMIYYVNATTLRQTIPPDAMLGRVNATMRFIVLGSQLCGALLSGVLAEMMGLRATLTIGACGNFVGATYLAFSPIARLTDAHEPIGGEAIAASS